MSRRLYRSRTDRMMNGVAGGVAEYLDADPTIVRVVWVVLAILTGGAFAVLYIVMWAIVPEGPDPAMPAEVGSGAVDPTTGRPAVASPSTGSAQPVHRHRQGSGGGSYVVGLILVGIGLYFLAREYLPRVDLDRLWPLGLVALGVVLLLVAMRRRPE